MKDLNKIKAAILAAFEKLGEIDTVEKFKKGDAITSNLLFGASGAVERLINKEVNNSLEVDFEVDTEGNINYYLNEEIINYNDEHPLSVPFDMYPAEYVWNLFKRGYFLAAKAKGGKPLDRYNFDRYIEEEEAYGENGDSDITLSITLLLLVVDSKVPQSVCVRYYIRRLQKHLEHSAFFARLKRYIPFYETPSEESPKLHPLPPESTTIPKENSSKKQASRIFTSEEEDDRWSVIVKKFVEDNQLNTPLNGRGDNPTLAMVCYFYEKWKKEPGLLVPNKTQAILNFFTQKCGLQKSTTDKNICNRINEYLKGNRKFENSPHIKERVYRIFSDYKLEKITTKKKA